MTRKLICLITLVLVLRLAGNADAGTEAFIEVDGMVVMEGENFQAADGRTDENGYEWFIDDTLAGFVGTGYVDTPSPQNTNGTWDNACEVTYEINFSTSGTYSVWLRRYSLGGGSNSVFVGLDGMSNGQNDNTEPHNQWVWKPLGTVNVTENRHTFNMRRREASYKIDRIVLTANGYTPTGDGPPESFRSGGPALAFNPSPALEANDVLRDSSLSWSPGEFANTHDVYFGISFDDVNDGVALVSPGQDANSYNPGRLEFSTTYFWRIDEVNAPPENTVFKGDIWSFTTEPYARPIPVHAISATASSQSPDQGPEKTIDRSGLDANDFHSAEISDMWVTAEGQALPAWIQYEFDKTYKLNEMLVWNYNGASFLASLGLQDVTVEYSIDGVNWIQNDSISVFNKAPGTEDYAADTTVPFGDVPVKYVKITATTNWSGNILEQQGLSEVQFLHIPLSARMPVPDDGATEVAIDVSLNWRAGREAAEHKVYLSADAQSVENSTAPAETVLETSYGPLSLDLASTYFWRIDEVNNANTIPVWEGGTWSFTTSDYLIVDDFESYNDIPEGEEGSNLVYLTWIDGYDNPATNGSTMGYPTGASMETDTVHGGRQSVPVMYDNTAANLSEVTVNPADLTIGSDWTKGAPATLSIWVYGDPNNAATEQMYVKINDAKIPFDGDLTQAEWQEFSIDLASLGINLSNITSITIGFERTAATGGSGMVFIDDIRLYAPLNN